MLLQLCLSSCSAMHRAVGERSVAGSHTHKAEDWGECGFTEGSHCAPQISCSSKLVPTTGKAMSTRCSWWGSSSQVLLGSHRCYKGIAVKELISNAASVWARQRATTCRNAAGAALSCSCTRQPSHRRCFMCTVLLDGGGGIIMLTRKQEHGST